MKKSIFAIIACLAVSLWSQAQEVVVDNFQQLQVVFSVGDIQTGKAVIDGRTFTQLTVEGMMPSAQVGAPNLPTWTRLIEVPLCDAFDVVVSGEEYDTLTLTGAVVAPVQPSRSKSDMGVYPLTIDEKLYATDAFFAAAPLAMVEAVGVARDRNLARLQFSPISYNPVSQQLVVCTKATVTVNYKGADADGSMEMFNRYYTPAFQSGANALNSLYPKSVSSTAPVRYLIVANSMFRGQLDTFVQWKKRKGFITDIVYTDDAAVGTTTTSIAAYIKSQYTNATAANPAPTFVLLVGDVAQIPAFNGSTLNSHVTDLNYSTWTSGDNIPDCYYGRFSAQNVSQLTPQIEKTLMYEQYTFSDPSFLDRAVMVAGIDGGSSDDYGYTHADPAMDYGITNYINGAHGFSNVYYFKNNTSITPSGVTNVTVNSNSSSNAATIRNYYSQGAGFINYSAHGSSSGWYNPGFETSHVSSMTNTQKFGLMIGNCCQTNMFGESACFGETLLRKDNYCGAVGYIGGSEVTYWYEDFYWAVGVRSSISATMSMAYNANNLGVYDRSFHTHGEAYSEWATNQGSIIYFGNMAVQASGSNKTAYYWEIYHLMGDPSVMTYLTQASQMNLSVASSCPTGTTSLAVSGAAPYAYVAVTKVDDRTLMGAGFADANGSVTLTLTALTVGNYEVVATASQYQPAYSTLTVSPSDGPYLQIVSLEPQASLDAGTTVRFKLKVKNIGSSRASGISVALNCESPLLALDTSISISQISAGSTLTRYVNATVSTMANGENVSIGVSATWTGSTDTVNYSTTVTVGEPFGEDFETGQFTLDWQQGQYPWEITNENATQGTYCARSYPSLGNNQTSEMSLTVDAYQTDVISFMYRVSSEANYDKFHFYLDGVEKIVESGNGSWTYAEYPITVGSHVLKFTYSKDVSQNANLDCALIDDLRVPRPLPEVNLTINVEHGTAFGAGTYRMGQAAQIGVFPEAGYTFGGWSDGNAANPRQLVVNSDCTLSALMSLCSTDTVTVTDTVTLTETVTVTDTVTEYVPVHDTTTIVVVELDTVTVTDTVTEYVPVHDTTTIVVEVLDTVTVTDTVTEYVPVHDTTTIVVVELDTVTVTDTVTLTETVTVTDTVTEYVPVHDTTTIEVVVLDTVTVTDTVSVTEYVPVHDTTTIEVVVLDTVTVTDTVTLTETVTVTDTVTVTEYVPVHDTTTVEVVVLDTVTVTDTVVVIEYSDTLTLYDTITLFDTIYIYDTIHDTIYINQQGIDGVDAVNLKVYQSLGQIVVEGADGRQVTLYDVTGRMLATKRDDYMPLRFDVPAVGTYMIKVGNHAARKVVVVR